MPRAKVLKRPAKPVPSRLPVRVKVSLSQDTADTIMRARIYPEERMAEACRRLIRFALMATAKEDA